jgi:hypothetical protein
MMWLQPLETAKPKRATPLHLKLLRAVYWAAVIGAALKLGGWI